MAKKNKPKDALDSDSDHVEADGDTVIDQDDVKALTKGWVGKFTKGWLDGHALAYATEHHLDEFCRINSQSAAEGTAYCQVAVKDMIRVYGVFGPFNAKSAPQPDSEEEEDDGRPYDDVDDLMSDKQKANATPRAKQKTLQGREGELLKAAHIERFRKSFTAWLRYQYKTYQGGDTLRGRGKSQSGPKTTKTRQTTRRSQDIEGEELSRLLIHELLGIGHSTSHVPHAFQLWAKDQPSKFRKKFLKQFAESGKPRNKRAGAEMAYCAQKYHACDDEEKEIYREKVRQLKEDALERKEELREKFSTRLEPNDAAKLLEAMPYVLDPLLTSLSAMLNAKLSLLIGVPEPTEGGVVTIKSFNKGDNHDDIPASFGQTHHYGRHVDAFKEFLNNAYTPEELRACAIPGSLPKLPKKGSAASQRSDGKKVVIVVQNMALPAGDNWITRKARLEDGEDDEEPTPLELRRLRKERRVAKARELEEHGPPVKRPRGRPRKAKVQEEDSDIENDDGQPPAKKKKKMMPEPAKKRSKRVSTTASGSATLGDVTTSRGRKKAQPKVSENRKKLLALAAAASSQSGGGSQKPPQRPSRSAERSPSPPPPPRPKPRPSGKRKESVVDDDADDDDHRPPPPYALGTTSYLALQEGLDN
ncbi:hypothetical protein BDZ89DRAFT_1145036 [Hymenopellis radicata]|nr:hypothetical protein BDZ89DRAFT_1145036 [Hymenopellis radicata]